MKNIGCAALLLIYWGGCAVLNEEVRTACTHGNCVHGWYSKYNTAEKVVFLAWAVGFPTVVALVAGAMDRSGPEAEASQARSKRRAARTYRRGRRKREQRALETARARKQWNCERCGATIAVGATYSYFTTWDGSRQNRHRLCAECAARE